MEWGRDLASEHEKYLTEIHFKGPVIVYGKTFFPSEKSVKCIREWLLRLSYGLCLYEVSLSAYAFVFVLRLS